MEQEPPEQAANTIAMLGRAYSLLGFQIVDGVVGAGFPQKPSHSAVFAPRASSVRRLPSELICANTAECEGFCGNPAPTTPSTI